MAGSETTTRIAREFHETYERLAPAHGWMTQAASAVKWEDVPEENRALMVSVVQELLDRGVIEAKRELRGSMELSS